MIGHRPFSHIPDLVNMRTVNIHDKRDVWFPKVYHGTWSKMLIRCIRHIFFRYLFDAIIFLNALFIGFDLDGGEPFFLALFTLEILLKDWLYANTPISKFASFSREKKTAWTFEKKTCQQLSIIDCITRNMQLFFYFCFISIFGKYRVL